MVNWWSTHIYRFDLTIVKEIISIVRVNRLAVLPTKVQVSQKCNFSPSIFSFFVHERSSKCYLLAPVWSLRTQILLNVSLVFGNPICSLGFINTLFNCPTSVVVRSFVPWSFLWNKWFLMTGYECRCTRKNRRVKSLRVASMRNNEKTSRRRKEKWRNILICVQRHQFLN
jgi:hypothetical protein